MSSRLPPQRTDSPLASSVKSTTPLPEKTHDTLIRGERLSNRESTLTIGIEQVEHAIDNLGEVAVAVLAHLTHARHEPPDALVKRGAIHQPAGRVVLESFERLEGARVVTGRMTVVNGPRPTNKRACRTAPRSD